LVTKSKISAFYEDQYSIIEQLTKRETDREQEIIRKNRMQFVTMSPNQRHKYTLKAKVPPTHKPSPPDVALRQYINDKKVRGMLDDITSEDEPM
jgi:hypothetical protein